MSSYLGRHPALRWAAPVTVIAVVGASQLVRTSADAAPSLPSRTPEQLVAAALSANVPNLSGTVATQANLGLPALPAGTSTGSTGSIPLSLLSGSHTAKVWYAEGGGSRVALLGDGTETDVVANRTDLWIWNSSDRSVQHAAVPAGSAKDSGDAKDGKADYTPQQIAAWALKQVGPSTTVSSSANVVVAGRSAYDLVLTPKQANTKIGSVHLAVDSKTSMPLQVKVFAKGAINPALTAGFTSVSYAKPASSNFRFTPPKGSRVKQLSASGHSKPSAPSSSVKPTGKVVGTAWESVFIGSVPGMSASKSDQATSLLNQLPKVSGSWGTGHLLNTALVTAVLTDSGTIAVGAVPSSVLLADLAKQ